MRPSAVLAYLVAAHSITVYLLLFIVGLNGSQPAIGRVLSALVSVALLELLLRPIPAEEWETARRVAETRK